MAKKNLNCEVLATVKGLDPKKPGEYTHAGTKDKPTLVELPDNDATRSLIQAGAIRIYPGPQAAETEKAATLKPADLKSLKKADEILVAIIERYQKELETADDEATKAAIETDIKEAEADLAAVRELLK